MKFLNKFWLVAVVSVGLFSCGDSALKGELAACMMKLDSIDSEIESNDTTEVQKAGLLAVYTLGDFSKNGSNIGTKLMVHPNDTNNSILQFYRVKKSSTGVTNFSIADLTQKTVEVYLSGLNTLNIIVIDTVNAHFNGRYKKFSASNSVDFKVSLAFAGVSGSRTIVGTEDDRPYSDVRIAYSNILYNTSSSRRVRISYVSKGPSEGDVLLSGSNTLVAIDSLSCKKSVTGVVEISGWGIDYQNCCPKCL